MRFTGAFAFLDVAFLEFFAAFALRDLTTFLELSLAARLFDLELLALDAFDVWGILIFWPGFNRPFAESPLARSNSDRGTPVRRATAESVSPRLI